MPPCVFTRASCPTEPTVAQKWRIVNATSALSVGAFQIVHTADNRCLTMPAEPQQHSTLSIAACSEGKARQQQWEIAPTGEIYISSAGKNLCLNNGLPMEAPANELQLYPCIQPASPNEKFEFLANGMIGVQPEPSKACVDVCLTATACKNVSV